MNAYLKWFGKNVTVAMEIFGTTVPKKDIGAISDFLEQQGYREISSTEAGTNAVRGRKIWNLINVGDPRRNYHSTNVYVGSDKIQVKTEVDTWFGLGDGT